MIRLVNPRATVWAVIRETNLAYTRPGNPHRMRFCMSCEGAIGIMAHKDIPYRCPLCGKRVAVPDGEIVKGLREVQIPTEQERRAESRKGGGHR
jgi:DNA-directed RNA polymerase subunit RPC12/RpoP